MSVRHILYRIRRFRAVKGWTINRLAKEAFVWEASLRRMDDDDWNPKINTIAKLEAIIPPEFDPGEDQGKAA